MELSVRLFAVLRERCGADSIELEGLPEELSVAELKRELERRHPELGSLGAVRCALDSTYAAEDAPVRSGAEIALLPPVSGGSSDGEDAELEQGVFELRAAPLDPAACQRRVEHPSCGACALFSGLVRDQNRERDVERLEYEAYDAMVGPEMTRIFARCRVELEADGGPRRLRMLVQHRTGEVAIGEPSVVVAVASPHRDLAFRACRFLIDGLKASLPVWKKEFYPGGEHWIGEGS